MPAILTHDFFGRDMLRRLQGEGEGGAPDAGAAGGEPATIATGREPAAGAADKGQPAVAADKAQAAVGAAAAHAAARPAAAVRVEGTRAAVKPTAGEPAEGAGPRDVPAATCASPDERAAFLLGNQGPDPLFYLRVDPVRHGLARLGSRMHAERTDRLLEMLHGVLAALDPRDVPVARAYAQGFLCHYMLDSRMHPLVYAQQFRICDAGVPGLDRSDGSAVHGEIERTFDEMVLYRTYRVTIADYSPAQQVLQASDAVLYTVGLMYSFLLSHVYGVKVDADLFGAAVRDFRFGVQALYSPQGTKRNAIGALERTVLHHRYSVVQAMSHRAEPVADPWLANPDHQAWSNPWTGAEDRRSFDDIYEDALNRAGRALARFAQPTFTAEDARAITGGVNFSGKPVAEA